MEKQDKIKLSASGVLMIVLFSVLSVGIYLVACLAAGKWLLPKSGYKPPLKPKRADSTSLTIDAAKFLVREHVALRNSYTKQLIERHMAHPRASGRDYAVPLWTIGIFGLKEGVGNESLKQQIERQKEQLMSQSHHHELSEELLSATQEDQDAHLDEFAEKIKRHFSGFSLFGKNAKATHKVVPYDVEVLLGPADSLSIDEIGKYSTGGRCNGQFGNESLMYRATLSETDVSFIKEVLSGVYDKDITEKIGVDIKSLGGLVAIQIRQTLCNELCNNFLLSKIIMWANARGNAEYAQNKKTAIHVLTIPESWNLLQKSLSSKAEELKKIATEGLRGAFVREDALYQGAKKSDAYKK